MSQNLKLSVFLIMAAAWGSLSDKVYAAGTKLVLEEVIVTSQKRAVGVSVQDSPLAITAVSERMIENIHAIDLTDVGRVAPNVRLAPVSGFVNYANFLIRGVGVNSSLRSIDPAVNIVQDGMVLGFQLGAILDTFDLESVEILRGPQGILHGRNTTGGAVSLRTPRPDGEFGIKAKAIIGSYGRADFSAAIEGTLVEDKLFAKVAVLSRDEDGYFEDNNGGTFVAAPANPSGLQPENQAVDQTRIDSLTVKPVLVFTPADNFKITLLGQLHKSEGGGGVSQLTNPSNITVGGTVIRDVYGFTPPPGKYKQNLNLGDHDLEEKHFIGEVEWDLGPGVVTSISSWRDVEYQSKTDFDGSPWHLLEFHADDSSDQFSQEIRYNSTNSEFYDFVFGAYYFDHSMDIIERRQVGGTLFFDGNFTQDQKSKAIFGNVDLNLTEKFTLGIGGRYTKEEKKIDMQTIGLCTGGGFTGCNRIPLKDKEDWDNFSPQIKLKYDFNDNMMSYLSWTKGFRSGNYFSRIVTTSTSDAAVDVARKLLGPTKEETLQSYELGFKSRLLDDRAQLNVALFYSDYDDIERTVGIPGSPGLQSNQNAASAKITGIEVEASFLVTDSFLLEANIGLLDPSYKEFRDLDVTGDGVPDPSLAKKLKFDHVSETTAYVAATYDFSRPDWMPGNLDLRVSYAWRSSYFTDAINLPETKQDDFGLLDASLTYRAEKWGLSLFGRNLTDDEYINVGISTAFGVLTWGGVPRTYGIELFLNY